MQADLAVSYSTDRRCDTKLSVQGGAGSSRRRARRSSYTESHFLLDILGGRATIVSGALLLGMEGPSTAGRRVCPPRLYTCESACSPMLLAVPLSVPAGRLSAPRRR